MIKPADLCAGSKQPESATLDRPLDHLVACHRRIEERLATLERVIPHLGTRRFEALEAIAGCFRFFDTNGAWHTADEEESLFPRLEPALTEEERAYLQELERQHDEAEGVYGQLKQAVEGLRRGHANEAAYQALVERLCALYRAHIASEDARLPEIGRRILSAAGLAEVSREMKQRRGLPHASGAN